MAKQKSFTLIEMLVVIFIIVLLIGIALLVFSRGDYQKRQNDTQRKKDIQEISNAVEEFKADHGHYPLINWGPGIHAYQKFPEFAGHTECNGTYGGDYTAYNDKYNGVGSTRFNPGTEIRLANGTNKACDDLSLQLLGRAYLPKMPFVSLKGTGDDPFENSSFNYTINHGSENADQWSTVGKKYIDEMPMDPVGRDYNVGTNCGGPGWASDKAADYDTNLGGPCTQTYQYLYVSYYDCDPEGIHVGDRYWITAIVQLQASGEPDDIPDLLHPPTGAYFYEWGTANWFRRPRSVCG